jgi:hypothetical protein
MTLALAGYRTPDELTPTPCNQRHAEDVPWSLSSAAATAIDPALDNGPSPFAVATRGDRA